MPRGTKKTAASGEIMTLADRLKQFREEQRARLQEQEAKLKQKYGKEAKKNLIAYIDQLKDNKLKSLWADYGETVGGSSNGGGGGLRRSKEDMTANAEAAVSALKDAGKEGMTGEQLRAKGIDTNGLAVAAKKYANATVKVEGRGPAAKYHFAH